MAALLGVTTARVAALARDGQIPGAVRPGHAWRFDRELVEPWAADRVLRQAATARRRAFWARVHDPAGVLAEYAAGRPVGEVAADHGLSVGQVRALVNNAGVRRPK